MEAPPGRARIAAQVRDLLFETVDTVRATALQDGAFVPHLLAGQSRVAFRSRVNPGVCVARNARPTLQSSMDAVALGQIRTLFPIRAVLVRVGYAAGFHRGAPAPTDILLMDPFLSSSDVDSAAPFRS
jgi:hypothetical protein